MRSKTTKGEVSASPSLFVEVEIEKLAIGGAGVARLDGKVIFVPDTAPGELVKAQITKDKKNFAEAELVEILRPSSARIEPACSIAKNCGGCSWQHISHEEQLRQKQQILSETLGKFLKNRELPILPIIPSPQSYRYRNRIQPKFVAGKLGFYKKRTHQLVPHLDCLITEESITKEFSAIQAELAKKRLSRPTTVEVFLDQQERVRWNIIDEESDSHGFSQVNRFQNEQLKEFVLKAIADEAYERIWDLYAGSGNFTFPVANAFPRTPMTAVELSEKLVERGKKLIQDQFIQFIHSDVEKFLKKAPVGKEDLVILDPPRAGCSELTMQKLGSLGPKKIVYISCHPVALARDLQNFLRSAEAGGISYKVEKIQPFEMFPQTDHMETIVVLTVDR